MAEATWESLPFDEAIAFLRKKISVPTDKWTDMVGEAHSRAFTVAGAAQDDLLADLRAAIDSALANGTTLETFRESFDEIVDRYGWNYKGGRDWRTSVIFNTNLSSAYSAGRYEQMNDPEVKRFRPYWRYLETSSENPRPEHLAWVNLVLPADDPWWDTHYPPNGWGCKCGVQSLSEDEVAEITGEYADTEFAVKREAPRQGTYDWTDPVTGETRQVPEGIDPGFDFNPGKAGAMLREIKP